MMKYSICIVWMLLTELSGLYAQTPVERMNKIKLSNEYIWNEYTHQSADSATAGALEGLLFYIDAPRGRKMTTDDIREFVEYVNIQRSKLTRVFAYMHNEDVNYVLGKGPKRVKRPEPVEVPADTVAADSVVTPEAALVQAPVPEQVQPATPVSAAPAAVSAPTQPTVKSVSAPKPAFAPMPLALEIMQQPDFFAVYEHIQKLQEEGRIIEFGPLKDVTEILTRHVVIFDKQTKHVACVLSPALIGDNRTNLINGNNDILDNYEDGRYIAIWFTPNNIK